MRVNTLSAFYARRNPDKVSEVTHILDHPTRTIRQLLGALRRKYGAIPAQELSEQDVVRLRCTMSGTCLNLTREASNSGARLVACTVPADSGGSLFALEAVHNTPRGTSSKERTQSSGFRLRDLGSGAVMTVLEDGCIGLADVVSTASPNPNTVFEIVVVMSPSSAVPLQSLAGGNEASDLHAQSEILLHGDGVASFLAATWTEDAPLAASAFGFASSDHIPLQDSSTAPQHEPEVGQQPSAAEEDTSDDWQVITMTKAMQARAMLSTIDATISR